MNFEVHIKIFLLDRWWLISQPCCLSSLEYKIFEGRYFGQVSFLLYPQSLEQCLVFSRCSVTDCWVDECFYHLTISLRDCCISLYVELTCCFLWFHMVFPCGDWSIIDSSNPPWGCLHTFAIINSTIVQYLHMCCFAHIYEYLCRIISRNGIASQRICTCKILMNIAKLIALKIYYTGIYPQFECAWHLHQLSDVSNSNLQ